MTSAGVLQILLFFALILVCVKPLGAFMANVFEGRRTFLHPVLRWLEVLTYKVAGVREDVEQRWTQYTASLLAFSIFGFLLVYLLQRAQAYLPFNPQNFGTPNVTPDLAFNTAVSFLTNTNWQSYVPEATLSYFVQMAALDGSEFRFGRRGYGDRDCRDPRIRAARSEDAGQFLGGHDARNVVRVAADFVRRRFVPVLARRDSESEAEHHRHHGGRRQADHHPGAGGVGGSHQGTGHQRRRLLQRQLRPSVRESNAAHQLVRDVADSGDSRGLDLHLRKNGGDTRQGWAIFAAFTVMFLVGVFVCYGFEQAGNPNLAKLGIQTTATATQAGGNMEGKEVRFGVVNSALFATITTDTSTGAVNNTHDSLLPIAGLVPMLNMMTDIVIFGGVGAGMYGILIYCIIAVFIAGLMVGRTPEYLGKKLEQKEVKMAMLAIIVTSACILVFSGLSTQAVFAAKGYWNPPGAAIANMNNSGPHGFGGNPVRLHQRHRQQRKRVRRHQRQHALVQPDPGTRDADRTVSVPDSDSGRGRQSGREEESAGHQRHFPDARPAVCGPAGGHGGDHRRPDLFPGGVAGADRRTLSDA